MDVGVLRDFYHKVKHHAGTYDAGRENISRLFRYLKCDVDAGTTGEIECLAMINDFLRT